MKLLYCGFWLDTKTWTKNLADKVLPKIKKVKWTQN